MPVRAFVAARDNGLDLILVALGAKDAPQQTVYNLINRFAEPEGE